MGKRIQVCHLDNFVAQSAISDALSRGPLPPAVKAAMTEGSYPGLSVTTTAQALLKEHPVVEVDPAIQPANVATRAFFQAAPAKFIQFDDPLSRLTLLREFKSVRPNAVASSPRTFAELQDLLPFDRISGLYNLRRSAVPQSSQSDKGSRQQRKKRNKRDREAAGSQTG